jgi:uncharacterized protein YndB with AHSA1/START domain
VDTRELVIEGDFEFSPAIVWDALTDPDLVSGWLAPASIAAEMGGRYSLAWSYPSGVAESSGRITGIAAHRRLEITDTTGAVTVFELAELSGGLRGTSTRLRVTAVGHSSTVATAAVRADWLTALDQLDALLRGHPVDWSHWASDHLELWSRHLREVRDTIA